MVRQETPTFPAQTTVTRFLKMAEAAQAAKQAQGQTEDAPVCPPPVDAFPRVRTLAEITAQQRENRAERRRKHEEARREVEASLGLPVSREEALRASYAPAAAQVRLRRPITRQMRAPKLPPSPRVLEELLDLAGVRPLRGKGAGQEGAERLARLLDALARHALAARGYLCLPSQITLHLSVELLAECLGVPTSTLRRWIGRLERVGYIHAKQHYTGSEEVRKESWQRRRVLAENRAEGRVAPARAPRATKSRRSRRPSSKDAVCDGTLFAIRLQPGHRARLSIEDLTHQWRDLDADRKAGRTAHRAIQLARLHAAQQAQAGAAPSAEKNMLGSLPLTGGVYMFETLKAWAVTPGQINNPLLDDPSIFPEDGPETVQDVIYTLSLVELAHPDKRPALVGMLASTLAKCLKDEHSRLHYCKLIWEAYQSTLEGRAGLQVFAAQLARLDVDRREWVGLRKPAALLTARLLSA